MCLPACHWWCPPFSAGHVALLFFCLPGLSLVSIGHEAFLFICLPGPSLLVPCSISIHLSFRSVSGGVRPCPLAMKHVYSSVSQVRYCWCPPCWPGSISIHLSPRCFTAGVRPFPQAMQHFYSFVSQVCHCCVRPFPSAMHQSPRSVTVGCPPFSAGDASFYSFVFQVCHCWCPPFPLAMQLSTLVLPPFSAGHVAFLCICLPCDFCLFAWCLRCCFLPDCLRECIPATLCNSLSFVFLFGQAFHE